MQNYVTLNFKVIHQGHAYRSRWNEFPDAFGTRWNEFPDPLNIGEKNNLQDSMHRNRAKPNDDIGHEFDAITSPK